VALFARTNPLLTWTIVGPDGDPYSDIERSPLFAPNQVPFGVEGEVATLGYFDFAAFRTMEFDSHGPAHVQAAGGGWLASSSWAAMDPLFFLLHTNVDRLWARWQVEKKRFDPADQAAYPLQGSSPAGNCLLLGQYSLDTMWPWNGATSPADPCRPDTAPGGSFPVLAPGIYVPPAQPRPHDMIEFRIAAASMGGAGFSYDSIPFN
jgi:tyrosinase